MNQSPSSDEIDLLQMLETIWDGKGKIITITAACVAVVFGLQTLTPAPNFVAKTEIKPILADDAEEYRQSNALGFFAVYRDVEARDQAQLSNSDRDVDIDSNIDGESDRDRDRDRDGDRKKIPSAVLDQLFIEQLGNRTLLLSILKKREFLKREEFNSDKDYERALMKMIAPLSIQPPVNEGEAWTLQFQYNNQGKWLTALEDLKETANKNVRAAIKSRFENLQASAKRKREFNLEDLDAKMSVLIAAYDSETRQRLAYLTEQAAIARRLGISQQTSFPQPSIYQNFDKQIVLGLDNRHNKMQGGEPLYLRGYKALEGEMELITTRQDKRAFIGRLLPLETKKLILLKDQSPERAERLFTETPIIKPGKFQATSFDVAATVFEYKTNRRFELVLAAMVGGIFGIIYVLIANAMRNKSTRKTKS